MKKSVIFHFYKFILFSSFAILYKNIKIKIIKKQYIHLSVITFIFSNTVQLASATTSVMRGHGGRDRMVVGFTHCLCNPCLSPLKL